MKTDNVYILFNGDDWLSGVSLRIVGVFSVLDKIIEVFK